MNTFDAAAGASTPLLNCGEVACDTIGPTCIGENDALITLEKRPLDVKPSVCESRKVHSSPDPDHSTQEGGCGRIELVEGQRAVKKECSQAKREARRRRKKEKRKKLRIANRSRRDQADRAAQQSEELVPPASHDISLRRAHSAALAPTTTKAGRQARDKDGQTAPALAQALRYSDSLDNDKQKLASIQTLLERKPYDPVSESILDPPSGTLGGRALSVINNAPVTTQKPPTLHSEVRIEEGIEDCVQKRILHHGNESLHNLSPIPLNSAMKTTADANDSVLEVLPRRSSRGKRNGTTFSPNTRESTCPILFEEVQTQDSPLRRSCNDDSIRLVPLGTKVPTKAEKCKFLDEETYGSDSSLSDAPSTRSSCTKDDESKSIAHESGYASAVSVAPRNLQQLNDAFPAPLSSPQTPSRSPSKRRKKIASAVSPYFPKSSIFPRERVSCIPFPSLDSTFFGLVQEKLSHEPFKMLIAVIFLNKTRGAVSIPVFYDFIARYPTPTQLAAADHAEIVELIKGLGLQNRRATMYIDLAKAWLINPPEKGKRYRRLHYPQRGDGRDISPQECPIPEGDPRSAWEVAHLPGIGAYAIDSWRIFCRDELRGFPSGLQPVPAPEAVELELRQEWTSVLPLDKELRAYLRWRWLRLGYAWNFLTGERKELDRPTLLKAMAGGVVYEGDTTWSFESNEQDISKLEPRASDNVVSKRQSDDLNRCMARQDQHSSEICDSRFFQSPHAGVPIETTVKVNMDRCDRSLSPSSGLRYRSKLWTDQEDEQIIQGYLKHGPSWDVIAADPDLQLSGRTGAQITYRVHQDHPKIAEIMGRKRRKWTTQEDEQVVKGYQKHGPQWEGIARDPSLNLSHRTPSSIRAQFNKRHSQIEVNRRSQVE